MIVTRILNKKCKKKYQTYDETQWFKMGRHEANRTKTNKKHRWRKQIWDKRKGTSLTMFEDRKWLQSRLDRCSFHGKKAGSSEKRFEFNNAQTKNSSTPSNDKNRPNPKKWSLETCSLNLHHLLMGLWVFRCPQLANVPSANKFQQGVWLFAASAFCPHSSTAITTQSKEGVSPESGGWCDWTLTASSVGWIYSNTAFLFSSKILGIQYCLENPAIGFATGWICRSD